MRGCRVLIAALAVVLASCTPDSDAGTTITGEPVVTSTVVTTTTEAPDGFGGEAVIGVGQPVHSLNPFARGVSAGTALAGEAVWATVYDIEAETWERIPDTAISLPSKTPGAIEVSEDGLMTVRYEIRRDAMWSDGTPITGADIAFTAAAMAQLAALGSPDVEPVMASVVATDSVERIAWITFSAASLAFEDALWIILPSHIVEAADLSVAEGFDWPSGGPFMVADLQQPGTLSLERNPHYWKTDESGAHLPYLDRLTILSSAEPGLEVDLFASRAVDVTVAPASPGAIGSIPDGAEIQQVPTPIVEHLTFQFGQGRDEINAESLNDSLAYRRAIAYSIDRPTLLRETEVSGMPETPGVLAPLGPSAWEVHPYDVDAGTASLQEVFGDAAFGFAPEATLSTTGNEEYRTRIAEALVADFKAVGIPLVTSFPDSIVFFGEHLSEGAFDIGMWAWSSDGGFGSQIELMERLDPASAAADSNFGSWGVGASSSEGSEMFSQLVAEAKRTVDPARFKEIAELAEKILAEKLPLIPLFQRGSTAAVWGDSLSGVIHNGSRSGITWNVEMWQKHGE